jgi:hypothetical protein
MVLKIENFRFSSSSVDDFPSPDSSTIRSASGRVRIASLNDLGGFRVAEDDTLIRISQKDFWKLGQDENGFFIERLVDDDLGPILG